MFKESMYAGVIFSPLRIIIRLQSLFVFPEYLNPERNSKGYKSYKRQKVRLCFSGHRVAHCLEIWSTEKEEKKHWEVRG